jgi:hypothetical protein
VALIEQPCDLAFEPGDVQAGDEMGGIGQRAHHRVDLLGRFNRSKRAEPPDYSCQP